MCCSGALLADVELVRSEVPGLEILGMDVEDDDSSAGVMLLPCRGLEGTRCSIYAHRPGACRDFECRLLVDVRGGVVTVDEALETIATTLARVGRVQQLLTQIEPRPVRLPLRERCAEALDTAPSSHPGTRLMRAELETAMAAVESRLRESFLD